MKPLIHSNGNSAESLKKEFKEAYQALRKAREAVQGITVHMRNYYPLENGGEVYQKDLQEKLDMLKALDGMEENVLSSIFYLDKN